MQVPEEVQARGPQAIEIFQNVIRKNGEGAYRGALMLALQEPPRANTEREFFEGHNHGAYLEDMGPIRRKRILAEAKKLGINPNSCVYKSGLGFIDNKADMLRIAKEKGKVIESDDPGLCYEPEIKPRAPVPLAPDIVDGFVRKRLAQDGALREKVKKNPKLLKEVRAAVTEKHTHPKKRHLVKG